MPGFPNLRGIRAFLFLRYALFAIKEVYMPEVKKVKVKFKKPHTHAGKDCKPGDTIEVRNDQAKWLEKIGVAEKEKGGK